MTLCRKKLRATRQVQPMYLFHRIKSNLTELAELLFDGVNGSIINDASIVDGAGQWNKFRYITLPLLLRILMPLLIASFTFNFNNFNVIYIFNFGNPPMPNTIVPMGHTDILISYVYNFAFASGRAKEYGLGSAITIIIFLIVAVITLFQFRYTKMWEEVGEGV